MREEDHWSGFADFVAFEAAAGGPSPNLELVRGVADVMSGSNERQLAWLACCYAAAYNTPVATAIWFEWPLERVLSRGNDSGELANWLTLHRDGLRVHSNRLRTHGASHKLARSLFDVASFAEQLDFERGDDFDRLWAQVSALPSIGRYFGIKLAGTLERLGLTEAKQYDIRARGAKNGRRTLALLYHGARDWLDLKTGGNGTEAVRCAEQCAAEAKKVMEDEHGLETTWFQFEALLCEYNQMVKGKRYPGSTGDGDYSALLRYEDHFGGRTSVSNVVRAARERTLPLGDAPKRKHLLGVYRDHGYVWSDAVYVDPDPSDDLSRPHLRSPSVTEWEPLIKP